jgi:general secretion pathway protein A
MYLEFFGLREMPFNITPDPRFLFFTRNHREAMDSVVYGILERKGFVQLVGEVGCGKTTICRAALASLSSRIQTALILNPTISETQLIKAILSDLGCAPKGNQRLALIEQLNAYLLDRARQGVNVAVIIDEAQTVSPALMEQIRLLSNLETDQHKLLQIVLAGQPELDRRLAEPGLRQLRQRVMIRAQLHPLSLDETMKYVTHRLEVAGADGEVGFEPAAAERVHRRSGGIPRLVNKICDRAMLSAYAAGRKRVAGEDVSRSITELEGVL